MSSDTRLADTDIYPALASVRKPSGELIHALVEKYPGGISFAPEYGANIGAAIGAIRRHLQLFRDQIRREPAHRDDGLHSAITSPDAVRLTRELVGRFLAVDEHIDIDAAAILLTSDRQEALYLTLRALRTSSSDVVIASSPTPRGLISAARLADIDVVPVRTGDDGIDRLDLVSVIHALTAAGLRPRACYVTPDYLAHAHTIMDDDARRDLLEIAARYDILLIEDNPHDLRRTEETHPRTLKALDTRKRVVHIGSVAEPELGSPMLGFVVADQVIHQPTGGDILLAAKLAQIKSMLTLHTTPVAQAVAGGLLIEQDCSLARSQAQILTREHTLRAHVTNEVVARLGDTTGIDWHVPVGGNFLVLTVPFDVDEALLELSARDYWVSWLPMTYFYRGGNAQNQLHLSFGNLSPDAVSTGLERLAAMITARSAAGATSHKA